MLKQSLYFAQISSIDFPEVAENIFTRLVTSGRFSGIYKQ